MQDAGQCRHRDSDDAGTVTTPDREPAGVAAREVRLEQGGLLTLPFGDSGSVPILPP